MSNPDLPLVDVQVVLEGPLSHSAGNSIHGVIYVQVGSLSFPNAAWYDKTSTLLIDWSRKVLQLQEGSRSEELWFLGKGNRMVLTAHGEQDCWTLEALSGWPNARRLAIATVRKSDFIRTLASATAHVAAYAREAKTGKKLLTELEGWLRQLERTQ